MESSEIIIVGAGIVGLATAYQLSIRHPRQRILVLEKEDQVAQHQTGHNSGVLHSGIYYQPGSLKATNCRTGKRALEDFCRQQGLPFETCGKVIVATQTEELERLQALYERGITNGVDCELIDQARLRELEPHCAGLRAIHVRESGIVDYRQVCARWVRLLGERGHRVLTGLPVTGLRETADTVLVRSGEQEFQGRYLVNCAGLHSDRVARLSGQAPAVSIVPFRGEYFLVKPEAQHLCRTLLYPVPDPRFPFLGVHFTRMIAGRVECGPNAVLAFAREGYRKTDFSLRDLWETLTARGFATMAFKFWKTGAGEMWRSFSKRAFVQALQRLVPEIRAEHLVSAPAGIRAQALAADGRLLDDFAFAESPRMVHVLNAPSPAATASLSIGQFIAEKLAQRFG